MQTRIASAGNRDPVPGNPAAFPRWRFFDHALEGTDLREARGASRGNTAPVHRNHPQCLGSRFGLRCDATGDGFFTEAFADRADDRR
jgi:hypothetical protein